MLPGVELAGAGFHAGVRPRRRTVIRTDRNTVKATCGLTSLPPGEAGPSEILALDRGHREIENRLHCVRDFSCDEDRSRIAPLGGVDLELPPRESGREPPPFD